MRYVVISDIHANLAAFKAVLRDAELRGGFDEIWCMGDVVGYGPEPHECIELLKQHRHICVAGNHDWAAVRKIDISDFHTDAAQVCWWTMQHITEDDAWYLQNLPIELRRGDFTMVHGSPRWPIWEYVLSVDEACASFGRMDTCFCFVGHSHVPLFFGQDDTGDCWMQRAPSEITLPAGHQRLIINPGGVGQPRDGDPRSSYVIYDDDARQISYYRVDYDITMTQQKMIERKLPSSLVLRLNYGY